MNLKSLFGTAGAVLAAWCALGVYTAQADDTFNGCTFYSRMKVAGSGTTTCPIVDVGFMPTGTTSIDAKFRPTSTSTSCLFCSRKNADKSGGSPHFTFFTSVSEYPRWDYNNNQTSPSVKTSLTTNYRLIIENGTAKLYTSTDRDPVSTISYTAATFSGTYRMYLFSSYANYSGYGNGGQYYFYYIKVYDGAIADGKLLHHYVPCKTSDGTVAVADLVDEKVYTASNAASALTVADTDSLGGVRPAVSESAFTKVATFTASGYAGSETLEEFPTLVRLSTSISGFSYDDCGENGANIRFADSDGKLLAHEIDTWNTSGESLIWVNVPKLSKTTEFKMYLGGDGSTATLPVSSIWRRAGYKLVFHNNVTATTAGADSAGSGLVGVAENNALAVSTSVEGAPLGSCDNQTGDQGWHVDNNTIWGGHGGQLSMSIWTYRADTSDNYSRALIGSPSKYVAAIYTSTTTGHLTIGGNLDACNVVLPVKSGNWMHINAVCDTKYYQFYQNGVQASGMSLTTAMADNTSAVFGVGSEKLTNRNKGYLDEARLRWDASTADWVKAEYDTVGNTSFLACGGVTPLTKLDPEEWTYSFTINLGNTMKAAIGEGSESAFPLLVRLSEDGISGFKYANFSQADYSDLVFVDADGNFLEYEVDTWDATGTSLVWVKVPTLKSSTSIKCRYHGPAYSHAATKVWSNYVGVWHMGEASGTAVDATGHELDGTPTGTSAAAVMVGTAGIVGKSRINQAATGKINGMLIPNYNSYITTASKFSVGGWYKATGANGYARPVSRKNSYEEATGFEVEFTNGSTTSAKVCGSSNAQVAFTVPDVTTDWVHIVYVFDGTTVTVYGNGSQCANGTIAAVAARDSGLMFGNNLKCAEAGWYGMYDELRLCDGALSATRVNLEYLAQGESSALDYSAVAVPDPDMPQLKYCEATTNDAGNVVVSGKVDNHAGKVVVTLTPESGTAIEKTIDSVAAGDDFSLEFSEADGLEKFASYTVSIKASNGEKSSTKSIADPVVYGKLVYTDYVYRFDVTVPDGFTATPLDNFPLLVRLSTAITGFDYSMFQRDGADIMAFDESGKGLPVELENWNTAGESRLWVQVPVVTNGTKVTICFSASEERPAAGAMWSEYASVLHLNETTAAGSQILDSTGNATPVNNALSTPGVEAILGAGCSMGEQTGKIGACATVPISTKLNECNGVFTASAWTKLNAAPYWGYLMSRKVLDATPTWGLQFRGGSDGNASDLAITTAGDSATSSERVMFSTLTCFSVGTWVKWTAVFNGTEISFYIDGVKFATQTAGKSAVNGSYALGIGGFADSTGHATLPAVFDEARVKVGAVSADWVAAEYKQEMGTLPLTYGAVAPTDPSAPTLETPTLTANGDGSFTVTMRIVDNMPAADTVVFVSEGTSYSMTTEDTAVPATYTGSFTPAKANSTGIVTGRAKAASGTTCTAKSSPFYSGALKIEKIRDATERGLTNGIFRVTRADTNLVLTVNLATNVASTAAVGVDYHEFADPFIATIPAGSNSVDVLVKPRMNLARDEDSTLIVDLAAGQYLIGAEYASATMTIVNYVLPAGGNIWCASAAGKASVDANWTTGIAPIDGTPVTFDGDISNADCEWDLGPSVSPSAWAQAANYTGTVTVDTTFGDAFPKLTVAGDMDVLGGTLTHKPHDADNQYDVYRLCLNVGGSLTVGESGTISARGLGSYGQRPEGYACYGGGYNGNSSWGSLTEPNAVGSSANDGDTHVGLAGGAIWIEVAGSASVNGAISANGVEGGDSNTYAGSGGSIYLKCKSLSGNGKISAKCESTSRGDSATTGAGGRISVLLTEGELTSFKYTNFDACAGYASKTLHAGTGTVLVRTPDYPNGVLYLRDSADKYSGSGYHPSAFNGCLTDIVAGETWTLDKIVFGPNALLRIPEGTTLELTGGLTSISSDAEDINCGLVVDGGTLSIPNGNQTMNGLWTLSARNTDPWVTVNGNLTLLGGANVGSPEMRQNTDNGSSIPTYGYSYLKVTGDMNVTSTGTLTARSCGLYKDKNSLLSTTTGFKGILQGHTHGGRVNVYKGKDTLQRFYTAYDSVFAPCLPGNAVPYPSGQAAEVSGGVIALNVGGKFTMDGNANVSGATDTYIAGNNCSGGTGGSIDITAGSIAGSGTILAEGGVKQAVCGAGGRIAIKLTDANAEVSSFKGKISASGRVRDSSGAAYASSAGTIFLRTADDGEAGGTIKIAMSAGNQDLNNPSTTELVSLGYGGDDVMDYKALSLELCDYGYGAVNTDLQMSKVVFSDTDSRLDLEGHTLTVSAATVNGTKVPAGTYVAGDVPFDTQLVDSVGGGKVRVTGYGIWVFIQ